MLAVQQTQTFQIYPQPYIDIIIMCTQVVHKHSYQGEQFQRNSNSKIRSTLLEM